MDTDTPKSDDQVPIEFQSDSEGEDVYLNTKEFLHASEISPKSENPYFDIPDDDGGSGMGFLTMFMIMVFCILLFYFLYWRRRKTSVDVQDAASDTFFFEGEMGSMGDFESDAWMDLEPADFH